MDKEGSLNEKLGKLQNELKVPKNQRNNFGNYNYRSCEDILEAVKPLLAKYDMTLTITDKLEQVGDRYYVKATAQLWSGIEPEGQASAYAREEETKKGMDGAQITGAASSYARKYALNGLFLIDDTKDSDATNTHDKEPVKEVTKGASHVAEYKMNELRQAFVDAQLAGDDVKDFCRKVIYKPVPTTNVEADKVLQALKTISEPF